MCKHVRQLGIVPHRSDSRVAHGEGQDTAHNPTANPHRKARLVPASTSGDYKSGYHQQLGKHWGGNAHWRQLQENMAFLGRETATASTPKKAVCEQRNIHRVQFQKRFCAKFRGKNNKNKPQIWPNPRKGQGITPEAPGRFVGVWT